LHELAHWTKTPERLNRDFGRKRFGDDGYAMEELVAELSACFNAADLGLEMGPREEHASYIGNWLKVLKGDERAIFTAASHAQKSADYLHGLQPTIVASAALPEREEAPSPAPGPRSSEGTPEPSHVAREMRRRTDRCKDAYFKPL
jgi:antirestriction protein ArdC